MNTKALTMFMAALQEGQRSILKTPDYSGKPCYDDGVAGEFTACCVELVFAID